MPDDRTQDTAAAASSDPSEVAALRAEVSRLREQNNELRDASRRPRRATWRGAASVAMIVVAALLLPIALVGFWGQRTLLDTEQYLATVAPLAQDPTIRVAVGNAISAQLHQQVDLEQRVAELLPPQARPLAGPISSGVRSFVDEQIQSFLASDTFARLWVDINRRTQQTLVLALQGQPSGAISISGSQVVLDTGELAEQVKSQLVERGLTVLTHVPIPPQADRQIVLLDAPALQEIRSIYTITQPIAAWLIYVVALMLLGGVLLAPNRPRTVLVVGLLLAVEAVLQRFALTIGQSVFQSQLVGTPFEQSANVFYETLTAYLLIAIRALLVLGLILAFAGWFAGGTPSAQATRGWLSRALTGAGRHASSGPLVAVGTWVRSRQTLLRVLILGVGAIVVLTLDRITGGTLVWILIGVLGGLAAVQVLVGAAPPLAPPESESPPP